MNDNARAHNLDLNTLGVIGRFCGGADVLNVSSPSDQVLVGVAHVHVPLSMPIIHATLHIDTLILPAIILKIVSLHDMSLIAAVAGHWLLVQLKEPWEKKHGRRHFSK